MDVVDGEVIIDGTPINELPKVDHLSKCWWRMADGKVILLKDMADDHLRNAALFLMGMGYRKCIMDESKRVLYLQLFEMEWKRRMRSGMFIARKRRNYHD